MVNAHRGGRWKRWKVWKWLALGGSPVGTLLGFVGVITDALPMQTRVVVVIVGFAVWIIGSFATLVGQRTQTADAVEIEALRSKLSQVGGMDFAVPDEALRLLVPTLFRPSVMWRLTVYVLEEEQGTLWLRRRFRCASSEIYESSGRSRIQLDKSFLREIRVTGLPLANEASDGPDREQNFSDWAAWQARVVGDEDIARAMRMPSRKYAWCAVREHGTGGRTLALMAETVQASGINAEQLRAPLMEPLLSLIVRLAELPEVVNPVVEDADHILRRL